MWLTEEIINFAVTCTRVFSEHYTWCIIINNFVFLVLFFLPTSG